MATPNMTFDPVKDIPDLSGKVIFITGGTSGIGKAAVLALALHNPAHIYFTGRNGQAGSDLIQEAKRLDSNCAITFIQCDLSSPRSSIHDAVANNFQSSRLDIFIANAGIMAVPAGLTAEGFEAQFGTNYLGHAILLRLLRPTMLQTAETNDVRFVVLSSFGHTMHPPGGIEFDKLKTADAGTSFSRYGQSKLADILLAKAMAKHYPQITSVSVHPGLVRTQLSDASEGSFNTFMLRLLKWTPAYKSAGKGAYNTLWAATAPKRNIVNGAYYEPVGKVPGAVRMSSGMAEICNDEGLAERLWQWTEEELGSLKM